MSLEILTSKLVHAICNKCSRSILEDDEVGMVYIPLSLVSDRGDRRKYVVVPNTEAFFFFCEGCCSTLFVSPGIITVKNIAWLREHHKEINAVDPTEIEKQFKELSSQKFMEMTMEQLKGRRRQ
jgi:hypothetical protein